MRRKASYCGWAVFFWVILGCTTTVTQIQEPTGLRAGDSFPEIAFPAPPEPHDREYLGVPDTPTFTLRDLKGNLAIVEILNVYCHSCNQQAPTINRLYDLIDSNAETRGVIQIIGIAVGNGDAEVEKFRDRHDIRYPVIPDPNYTLHRAIGSTRTPFSIYVRKDTAGKVGRIAGTHLGARFDEKKLYKEAIAMLHSDSTADDAAGKSEWENAQYVDPVLTAPEERLAVEAAFESLSDRVTELEKIALPLSRTVYSAEVMYQGGTRRLFAEVVGRTVPCDVCHDAHFIYVFDSTGQVLGFAPIQLTKYDNDIWDDSDLEKIRSGIIGKYIFNPFSFDPDIDAISSATITTAVIFDSLSRGKPLMDALKKKGLL